MVSVNAIRIVGTAVMAVAMFGLVKFAGWGYGRFGIAFAAIFIAGCIALAFVIDRSDNKPSN